MNTVENIETSIYPIPIKDTPSTPSRIIDNRFGKVSNLELNSTARRNVEKKGPNGNSSHTRHVLAAMPVAIVGQKWPPIVEGVRGTRTKNPDVPGSKSDDKKLRERFCRAENEEYANGRVSRSGATS